MLHTALQNTAALWYPLWVATSWVRRAAGILENPNGECGAAVRAGLEALLAEMERGKASLGPLTAAVEQFVAVTRRFGANLFYCYDHPDLPRTNNDLEHCFGVLRHNERRATGRKRTSATVVLRGSVRLAALLGTGVQPCTPASLQPEDPAAYRQLRARLAAGHRKQQAALRFRKDPEAYLASLEAKWHESRLLT